MGSHKKRNSQRRKKENGGNGKWVTSIFRRPQKGKIITFDALFGADGLNSQVAELMNFERRTMKAKQAIGMTFNFVNSRTREEAALNEFGYPRHMMKDWFEELEKNTGISLENCVYYRDETHYFVCTIPKENLVKMKIIHKDFPDSADLLHPKNLNHKAMKNFARKVASHCELPDNIEFKKNNWGREDIQLFDFTKKLAATEQIKFVKDRPSKPLFVCLVGDALLEPFWPQGTGVNRAILSALDGIFCRMEFLSGKSTDEILAASSRILSQMHLSSAENISHDVVKTTMDKIGTKSY